MLRVGFPDQASPDLADRIREAGGEPVPILIPAPPEEWGVTLAREWVADAAEVALSNAGASTGAAGKLDAFFIDDSRPEVLAGLFTAALRLDLLAVCVSAPVEPFTVALAGLGLVPLKKGNAVEAGVEAARFGFPRAGRLSGSFPLTNALRAGLAAGGGPEVIVHLAALANESGVHGFPQILRVVAPEAPVVCDTTSGFFTAHGAAGLLASLGNAIHDAPTVSGPLKKLLPDLSGEQPEPGGSRVSFVRGRASGLEAICHAPPGTEEVSGSCRAFASEEKAVRAVLGGELSTGEMLVVGGGGPQGGPGLVRLDRLEAALAGEGLAGEVPVFTDGLTPDRSPGARISLCTPESVAGGVLGLLRDGDFLRILPKDGRIRAGVDPRELEDREPPDDLQDDRTGYAARYARYSLPALEGGGFA